MFKEIWYGLNAFADHLFTKMTGMTLEDFSYGGAGLSEADLSEEVTVEKTYDKRRLLKIKLKSLHEEVKIIRHEEEKLQSCKSEGAKKLVAEMAGHRRCDIREESRATLLAYGYIRGRKYQQIEPKSSWTQSDSKRMFDMYRWAGRLRRISTMVEKYGPPGTKPAFIQETAEKIQAWMCEGMEDKPPVVTAFHKTANGGR